MLEYSRKHSLVILLAGCCFYLLASKITEKDPWLVLTITGENFNPSRYQLTLCDQKIPLRKAITIINQPCGGTLTLLDLNANKIIIDEGYVTSSLIQSYVVSGSSVQLTVASDY